MDKVDYIVANQEQELNVLKKLEQEGFKWCDNDLPTAFIFSECLLFHGFPYIISEHKDMGYVGWSYYSEDYEGKIVYDGRKEEKMKKYLVTKEFMNELIEWGDENDIKLDEEDALSYVIGEDIMILPNKVDEWWDEIDNPRERNNRLIAILQWLNGEDVFETQKTYKYYVAHTRYPGMYLSMKKLYHSEFPKYDSNSSEKKIFDTREEAEKWVIPGYEVVEIDENEL